MRHPRSVPIPLRIFAGIWLAATAVHGQVRGPVVTPRPPVPVPVVPQIPVPVQQTPYRPPVPTPTPIPRPAPPLVIVDPAPFPVNGTIIRDPLQPAPPATPAPQPYPIEAGPVTTPEENLEPDRAREREQISDLIRRAGEDTRQHAAILDKVGRIAR